VRDPGHHILATILADLPLGVWVARAPTGEVVYANRAFEAILGMDAVDDVTIDAAPATYSIQDPSGAPYPVEKLPFSRALATGAPVTVDDLVIDRGPKGRVNVRAFAAPLRDAGGAIAFIAIAFIDITAEVRAVADRKQAEAQLSFAVHHAPVVLWATDRDGTVTLSEGSALAAMGFRSGQLVGQSVFDLYAHHPGVLANLRRALAGEQVIDVVEVGDQVLEIFVTPVRDATGVSGVIGMATDVTERHRLQGRIIQGDRVAAMGTLAASVAHEINNPLTYVLGNLAAGSEQLAAVARALNETTSGRGDRLASAVAALTSVGALLAEARKGAERIGRIARDLHSFARPADEVVRPIPLDDVIGSVLRLVQKEIEARARLTVELGATPPVRGNESRLVQVVLNLLVNAWQALPEAAPDRHEIAVRTRVEGKSAAIEVSDTGPGVAPQNRQRIFEPFFTTKEVGAGTGLGLFVCRNIIEALGGQISVRERPGGGALFQVLVPLWEGTDPTLRPRPPEVKAPPAPAPARRARVLIIDDDESVARVLVQSLEGEFDVRAVLDGREALGMLAGEGGPDLAYCDLMMNGLSGMELHAALSRLAPQRLSKLVFMTGGAFTTEAAAFVDRLGDAVVYKPFDIVAETRRRLAG
jgi:two-component system cell cycle sensor histidine kinase/response regulator CckA